MKFRGRVYVMPRADLLDPQGKAVGGALKQLGFVAVSDVRVGKLIEVAFEADDSDAALAQLREMCEKLLVNPITEDFDYILMSEDSPQASDPAPDAERKARAERFIWREGDITIENAEPSDDTAPQRE